MHTRTRNSRPKSCRRGTAAVIVAIVLLMLFGFVALAIDVGLMAMTKTQLHAATDASTLSGGTELLPGLGRNPVAVATVEANARAIAVAVASQHRNGDVGSTYADATRDVKFGWAVFDNNTGAWQRNVGQQLPNVGGYNMIEVTLHRDQAGSSNADTPYPLMFARLLGNNSADLHTQAAAVIMPANGIRITPGSSVTANIMPFAVSAPLWDKYIRAQTYYAANGLPSPVFDPDPSIGPWDSVTGEPLFGHLTTPTGNQTPEFVQDFDDIWSCGCVTSDQSSTVAAGSDGVLEIDIYPRDDYTAGNFGTIDVGSAANGTPELVRQIVDGANATDMSHYSPDYAFVLPRTTTGDTGVSVGIKDALDAAQGQCRPIFLFDGVTAVGNTTEFSLVRMEGVRVMHSELTGNLDFKHLSLQLCDAQLSGATGDHDRQIDASTTVFTPLILIR